MYKHVHRHSEYYATDQWIRGIGTVRIELFENDAFRNFVKCYLLHEMRICDIHVLKKICF